MAHNNLNISDQILETVKYRMKKTLIDNYLPVPPDDEDGWPIFSDYSSWVYRYLEFVEDEVCGKNRISFKTKVVLKKQFHQFVECHRFYFSVVCVYSGRKYEVNVLKLGS